MPLTLARAAGAALVVFLLYGALPQALLRVAHRVPPGIDPFFVLFTMQVAVFAGVAVVLRVPLRAVLRPGLVAPGLRAVVWLWSGGILLALLASVSAVSAAHPSGFSAADGLVALARGFPNSGVAGALLQRGLLVPALEELLFRVVVLGVLLRTVKPWPALLISAVLFATGHASWLVSGFMGVAFGLLYLRYGSAWLCILAHAGHNLLVALGAPLLVAYLHGQGLFAPIQHHLLVLQSAWFAAVVACFWMFFHHVLPAAAGSPPSFPAQPSRPHRQPS